MEARQAKLSGPHAPAALPTPKVEQEITHFQNLLSQATLENRNLTVRLKSVEAERDEVKTALINLRKQTEKQGNELARLEERWHTTKGEVYLQEANNRWNKKALELSRKEKG